MLKRRAARGVLAAVAAVLVALAPRAADAADANVASGCPAVLSGATRLVVVVTPSMSADDARVRLFGRSRAGDPWQAAGPAWNATVGRNGLGWAWNQTALAEGAEPVKREGDGRTPAGIFAAGAPFGHAPRDLQGFLHIDRARTVCVDDIRSPHYNRIVDVGLLAPGHSAERMGAIGLYRQGIAVDHATSRVLSGGSCIFVHVWRAPGRPTAGCVAMAQERVRALQDAFDAHTAAIAILPEGAVARLRACGLPHS